MTTIRTAPLLVSGFRGALFAFSDAFWSQQFERRLDGRTSFDAVVYALRKCGYKVGVVYCSTDAVLKHIIEPTCLVPSNSIGKALAVGFPGIRKSQVMCVADSASPWLSPQERCATGSLGVFDACDGQDPFFQLAERLPGNAALVSHKLFKFGHPQIDADKLECKSLSSWPKYSMMAGCVSSATEALNQNMPV